jgi:methionine-rich copper-binding protein CopC
MMPRELLFLALCASGLITSTTVSAHAIVVEAAPAANAVVDGAHVAINLRFNSRVDIDRSRLSVVDAANQTRVLVIDPASPPDRIQAVARDLQPGEQHLEWYVLSADGHITRGRLKFKVAHRP